MDIGVMKDQQLKSGIYIPRMHWVVRGTGTPEDKDEVNKHSSECDG
jgi:hypothetical protein